ncbi:MAG: LuxR C-terminal-related transcriptional regulator [Acidimicrobiia bacterium]
MTSSETVTRLEVAHNALNNARWGEARDAYLAALAVARTPEAMDGLGRAQWWLGETESSIASRVSAYTSYRRSGRLGEAARIAIWLSLEYAATPGREALAAGWMRRAGRMLEETPRSAVHGWLALSRSSAEGDPVRVAALAEDALAASRRFGDADLEIRALARLGLAHVSSGRIDEGMGLLDEAMAAAAAAEGDRPETFAETCCDMVAACEATLDGRRLEQWGKVAERFLEVRLHAPLLAFCGACCAGVFAARGDLGGAEQWLTWAIDRLEQSGHESRCVDPKAKLAEIRLEQGRFEEAQRLLVGIERRPEAIRPAVNLHLARGETGAAVSVLHRRLAKIGADSVGAIPILGLLVPVQIERGDLIGAAESAAGIVHLAELTGSDRHRAEGELAVGRVAMAQGDPVRAASALAAALEGFDRARMPLDAARARLDLARALAPDQPELAVVEARAAATAFQKAGAMRRADEADALLRSLGARGRVGPKGSGRLTKREEEVLQLLTEGLTNVEIGERLFIAPKTVVNHVSNVLMKLNLRSRTEAAAYALRRGSGR